MLDWPGSLNLNRESVLPMTAEMTRRWWECPEGGKGDAVGVGKEESKDHFWLFPYLFTHSTQESQI
jgi:hypothetical protein